MSVKHTKLLPYRLVSPGEYLPLIRFIMVFILVFQVLAKAHGDTIGNASNAFIVDNVQPPAIAKTPQVAWGSGKEFAVVWLDNSDGNSPFNALFSIFDGNTLSLKNILVLQADYTHAARDVDVAETGKGYITVYGDEEPTYKLFDALVTAIDKAGQFTDAGPLNSLFQDVGVSSTRISSDGDNMACAVWTDTRYGQDEIPDSAFARRVNADCVLHDGYDFSINHVEEGKFIREVRALTPVTAANDNSDFLAVWTDDRILVESKPAGSQIETTTSPRFDIYCRMIPNTFTKTQGNYLDTPYYMVSADDGYPVDALDPETAYGNGKFLVVWEDSPDVYARRLNSDGIPELTEFPVNDVLEGVQSKDPSVSHIGSGRFLIVWRDSRNQGSLRARVYDAMDHQWLTNDVDLFEAGILYIDAGTALAANGFGMSLVCFADPPDPAHVIGIVYQVSKLGDLTGEGTVNGLDTLRLTPTWNPAGTQPVDTTGDLNGDNKVNAKDLLLLLGYRFADRKVVGKPIPEKPARSSKAFEITRVVRRGENSSERLSPIVSKPSR